MLSPLHQKDSYKIGHVFQYPAGTEMVYSNFTARSGKLSNIPGSKGITFIGLQYFIKNYLIEDWNNNFFKKNKEEVVKKYQKRVRGILGYDVSTKHIEGLHDLGFLPITIKALPEGSFVPYGVPMLTVRSNLVGFYWVTNLIESVLSAELWQPITSATTYIAFRKMFEHFAEYTGSPKEFCAYQGHDFSFRGMAGRYAAASSGAAVLLSGCKGTDNIPAIDLVEEYYNADSDKEVIGQSVDATEHSVMCACGKADEKETFINLLTKVYPKGNLSVVSDSWDFWKVVTEILPSIKDIIMKREGKLIIRPDSGDPVDIICGDDTHSNFDSPEYKGLIECLWDTFGGTINEEGYKVLDPHIGAIYGDGITYERAQRILTLLESKGFASCNIVFGLGSYTFQYVTRDTHGMAFKSTLAQINDKLNPIFKDPKTDKSLKKSAKGFLMVTKVGDQYKLVEEVSRDQENHGCLETVFRDSRLIKEESLQTIRSRVNYD